MKSEVPGEVPDLSWESLTTEKTRSQRRFIFSRIYFSRPRTLPNPLLAATPYLTPHVLYAYSHGPRNSSVFPFRLAAWRKCALSGRKKESSLLAVS